MGFINEEVSANKIYLDDPFASMTLEELEMAIKLGELPITEGFFFGDNADEENKERDLKIIKVAQEAIKSNLEVYYNSWW